MARTASEKEYLEIDLMRLFQALWRRAWIIILTMIVFGASLFCYASYIITPTYTASAMLYVNNSSISVGGASISIENNDLIAAQSLVDTYVVILTTRKVLNEVIEKADLTYQYEDLKRMISAEPVNSTEVFEISVVSEDPLEAEKIANTICYVLPEKIEEIVNGTKPSIVDYAVVPSQKSAPNVTQYTAIGMLIGLLCSSLIIVIMEMFDQYIRSEEYLMQMFSDIPVLAVIPDLEGGSSKDRYYYYSSQKKGE